MKTFSISEYGCIRRAADFPGAESRPDELYLPDAAFNSLKQLATGPDGSAVLTYSVQRGRELLRTRNFVGLLETADGTRLELLPKIPQAHEALLTMLRYLPDRPFRQLAQARVGAARLPLWEVFITAFLDDVTALLTTGLQRSYVAESGDRTFLRGKLLVSEQLRRNGPHAERFAVRYQALTAGNAHNRVLKAALHYVAARTGRVQNQRRVRQLLFALDDVPDAAPTADDWRVVRAGNRLFRQYEPVIRWADVLLHGQTFGPTAGPFLKLSLLFPMERVFEAYVAAGFRKVVTDGELLIQEAGTHLVDTHSGSPRFRLRPDVVLRQNGQTTVFDTKWQWITGDDPAGQYGIDQADLYQLYAYGKKYGAQRLVLIYPAHDGFRRPLDLFGYDPTLTLHVLPFDVTEPLPVAVEKLLAASLC